MRTIKTIAYKFQELTEEAKQKAVNNLSNINLDFSWWDCIYEDANTIGLKIESFDLDRNKHATGTFEDSSFIVANSIIENHGEKTETYKLAKALIEDWNNLVIKYSDGIETEKVTEDNENEFDEEADELEKDFFKSILSEYADALQEQYEYLYSEEAIIETIEANEYEFTEQGKLI